MAESSKAPADKPGSNPQEGSNGGMMSWEQVQAAWVAARERANNHPTPPANNGVPAGEAMRALADMEEEGLREDLADPETTETERAKIKSQLDSIQQRRAWFDFVKTLEPPTNSESNFPPSASPPSRTGKEPSP